MENMRLHTKSAIILFGLAGLTLGGSIAGSATPVQVQTAAAEAPVTTTTAPAPTMTIAPAPTEPPAPAPIVESQPSESQGSVVPTTAAPVRVVTTTVASAKKPAAPTATAPAPLTEIITGPEGDPGVLINGEPCVNCSTEARWYRDHLGHCFETGVSDLPADMVQDATCAPGASATPQLSPEDLAPYIEKRARQSGQQ